MSSLSLSQLLIVQIVRVWAQDEKFFCCCNDTAQLTEKFVSGKNLKLLTILRSAHMKVRS